MRVLVTAASRHGATLEIADAIAAKPVWLFSCGPLGPPEALKPEGDPVDVTDQAAAAQAIEHRVFAGRLDKGLLSFPEKAVVVAVRAPEGDFRDWDAIDAFAGEVAERLR